MGIHDIIFATRSCHAVFDKRKNPYKETYFGTPVESFNYDEPDNLDAVNPALYHLEMPPLVSFVSFGFYVVGV